MLGPTSYIKASPELAETVALVTDGRFSGGSAGAAIGHVSPEAPSAPIGLLQGGDIIEIDIPGKRLDVKISEAELVARRKAWKAPPPRINHGCVGSTPFMATSASTGAVLKWDHLLPRQD